jgi:hypothetical protein
VSPCTTYGPESISDKLAGILSRSIITNDYDKGIVMNPRHDTPADAVDLEHEFGDLNQNVGRINFVEVYENPISYHMFSLEGSPEIVAITK